MGKMYFYFTFKLPEPLLISLILVKRFFLYIPQVQWKVVADVLENKPTSIGHNCHNLGEKCVVCFHIHSLIANHLIIFCSQVSLAILLLPPVFILWTARRNTFCLIQSNLRVPRFRLKCFTKKR